MATKGGLVGLKEAVLLQSLHSRLWGEWSIPSKPNQKWISWDSCATFTARISMYFHVIISMYFHVFQCISCIKSSLTPDLCQVDDSVTDGDGTVVSDGDGTVGSVIDSDAMDGGEVVSGDGLQVWTSDIVEICWDQWSQCEKKNQHSSACDMRWRCLCAVSLWRSPGRSGRRGSWSAWHRHCSKRPWKWYHCRRGVDGSVWPIVKYYIILYIILYNNNIQ